MKYNLRSLMIVAAAVPPLIATIFFACRSLPRNGPELVRVEGEVRLNGKPVSEAAVYFAFNDGNFANGLTNERGEFMLGFNGYPGCPPKPAKVLVNSNGGLRPSGVVIPARYGDGRRTPLTASPQRGKPNYIVLDLSTP